MMHARTSALVLIAATALTATLSASGQATGTGRQTAPPAAQATNDVAVTITYTGKGPVDPTHQILLFLFSTPNIVATSQPLGPPQFAAKNGTTVTFKGVTTSPVYVLAIYDEKSTYNGTGGPPPAGTPISIYTRDPKLAPTAVTPGPKTAIKMSFNDSKRWAQ